MSMSFDAHLLSVAKLTEEINAAKTQGDIELLPKILEQFGALKDDMFLLQCVEYWHDYNPYFELMTFIEKYYGFTTGYEVVSAAKLMSTDSGANAFDVASELSIELPEDDEDEE